MTSTTQQTRQSAFSDSIVQSLSGAFESPLAYNSQAIRDAVSELSSDDLDENFADLLTLDGLGPTEKTFLSLCQFLFVADGPDAFSLRNTIWNAGASLLSSVVLAKMPISASAQQVRQRGVLIVKGPEYWKPVVDFEADYSISSWGRIKRLTLSPQGQHRLPGIRAPFKTTKGYLRVELCSRGRRISRLLHQIVADAFLGPCPDGHEVHFKHPDGDKTRCWANNLEYHPAAKLTAKDLEEIRRLIASGETRIALAKRFGVTTATIHRRLGPDQ